MPSRGTPTLRFLWHPGTLNIFSGYGLALRPAHLVGLLMIDRPEPADPAWLAFIQRAFGEYQLTRMTRGGERGIVCQMIIAVTSTPYLRVLPHPQTDALRAALLPLLHNPPAVTLALAWNQERHCWVSQIIIPRVPLFPLGMVVGTPGAVRALQKAGQQSAEFLDRHVNGDWGDIPEEDRKENEFSLQHGFRILSAYTTGAGDRIWILTEADRSATMILLQHEY